jgi:hypothetical protein
MASILIDGDTAPTINGTITDSTTGDPLNLTSCTVYFQLRRASDRRFLINAECDIISASAGTVSYDLTAADLDFGAADCLARFLVVYPDATRQHTTPALSVTVEAQ